MLNASDVACIVSPSIPVHCVSLQALLVSSFTRYPACAPPPPLHCYTQVLLVGGFSASPYLQDKAKSGLRTEAAAPQVVVMEEPYAAVLQGASVCTGQRNGGRACWVE